MTSSSWFSADCSVELRTMSAEPSGLPVSPGASRTPPVPPQVDSEPQVSPPLQMEPSQHVKTSIREGSAAFPVRDSAPHRPKDSPEERGRRHSADGATAGEGRGHFHPYQRQYSDGSPQDSTPIHSLYPKPIYSYSILIFMALRSSRTGSLPVSEIYGFMTEHFPYFKTAPDGWKNSVRHNLSLNKCFEKVENRSGGGAGGGASRKGCLWALNPARVEKMQEELHKWRRKDPLTVRKSMARPEELGRLLGENTDGLRPVPSHFTCPSHLQGPAHLATPGQTPPPRGRASFDPPPSFGHSQPGAPGYAFGHSHQSQAPPPFSYPSSGIPQEAGGALESPLAAQTPLYSAALQAHHCRPRTMQELLMDGELCSDIDTLNPTLTDLQLQGNLWEELRNDSLAPDSLQLVPTSASPAPPNHAGTLSPCCP
ncbi:forkhead box protein N1 [Anguilla anguilla]|uniref:forkhead box protein N1 n=1 Tax=Anguilla anguilla TaxID=7936 RepID=UPI0015AC87D4|nr:forkhead box protein N1 [Anguilla anguilla]